MKVTYYNMFLFMETFSSFFMDQRVLHASLSPKYNRNMVFNAGEGAGRSGSFFFYSHDRKFIIKTMTKDELNLYLKLLPKFARHYLANPSSLIARIFGVFTVNMCSAGKVHFMLMENTLRIEDSNKI